RAEGHANARFVEARARLMPESGAQWIEVAGAYAMFDGVDSPVTQSFGLGLFQPPEAAGMDRLESFFHERGAAVQHEVSPVAGKAVLAVLNERGYRPFELSSVLFLPLDSRAATAATASSIKVRQAGSGEQELWAQTAAGGWQEHHPRMAQSGRAAGAA
ncbi:MAG: hypothetical protein NTY38_11350, partial [Acidobacteria bacterium]|nr:hypothetical protein [Acidobacteriota bacterium]